jgi:hypothetical protein
MSSSPSICYNCNATTTELSQKGLCRRCNGKLERKINKSHWVDSSNNSNLTGSDVELDKLTKKISWFGVPAIVFLTVMSFAPAGVFGAAAYTWTLSAIAGPFGMVAGGVVLLFLSKNSEKITDFGIEKVLTLVLKEMNKKGTHKTEIINKINKYPLSNEMKSKVINHIKSLR